MPWGPLRAGPHPVRPGRAGACKLTLDRLIHGSAAAVAYDLLGRAPWTAAVPTGAEGARPGLPIAPSSLTRHRAIALVAGRLGTTRPRSGAVAGGQRNPRSPCAKPPTSPASAAPMPRLGGRQAIQADRQGRARTSVAMPNDPHLAAVGAWPSTGPVGPERRRRLARAGRPPPIRAPAPGRRPSASRGPASPPGAPRGGRSSSAWCRTIRIPWPCISGWPGVLDAHGAGNGRRPDQSGEAGDRGAQQRAVRRGVCASQLGRAADAYRAANRLRATCNRRQRRRLPLLLDVFNSRLDARQTARALRFRRA